MLLNTIPKDFDAEIDESNNPNYAKDYEEKYGGLNGWIKFHGPKGSYFGYYRNGKLHGPGFEFWGDSLIEQVANDDVTISRLIRGEHPRIFVSSDGEYNALSIQEKELRELGFNRESVVSLGFVLGYTSRVSALRFHMGAQAVHAQNKAAFLPCAGCAYPIFSFVDPKNPDWLSLQGSLNDSIVKLTLDDDSIESLEGFGNVQDVPFYRVLFNLALLNWSREQGIDILEKDNFENVISHIKSQFSFLAPIYGDESLILALKEQSDSGSEFILNSLIKVMQGNVHDKNFQDAWCSGMLIGEAFISWDLRYTLWLWDYCIVDLFQSRFIRVFSSLPNAKALDEVLSDRGVKEAVHGAVNPLWGLRDLSNLARCYSACREDHPGRKTTELELVVVIRLHNRDFYQSAIEKHDLMMTGKPDSSGHPQHRAGFADNDIHDYSSDFLEKVVDTSVVNECIRDGQTINLLKTIAYAAATEQSTQNYIKSEIDQNYTVSIHAFNYASHFNKWETAFLELNRKIGSRERRASTSIQNLDETMSVIYDCVWDIVESYQEDA